MPNACESFKDKILDWDAFGEGFTFKLPNGKETTRTWVGVIFTVLIYGVIMLYAYMKFAKVIAYGDSTIISSITDSAWTAEDKWRSVADREDGQDNGGLQFAVGVTAYDSNQQPVDDPKIGRIVARYQTWGLGDGMGSGLSNPIPMKRCSRVDLGIAWAGTLSDQTVVKDNKDGDDITWE